MKAMNRRWLATLTVAGAAASVGFAGTAVADEPIQLTGVIRDFKVSHPDMEYPTKNFGVRTGLVKPTLGDDGKPVLNTAIDYTKGMIAGPESFNQWFRDVPDVNIAIPYTITLQKSDPQRPHLYIFAVEKPHYFFPIDGLGWNDKAKDANGNWRNFYFTYEIHTEFTFSPRSERSHDLVFTFTGDDDVWVFINGKLAVDIGGVHGQTTKSVNLDQNKTALGLVEGNTYKLDFFFAERHTTESNFRIETTMTLKEVPPTTVSPLYD
jgi:fibro-slime domain-containing protein